MDEYDDLDPQGGHRDEAGDLPPSTPGGEAPDDPAGTLEAENAALRQELRRTRAERLVDRHNLPPSYVDVLANVPRDKQDARAAEFAAELEEMHPSRRDPELDESGEGGDQPGSQPPAHTSTDEEPSSEDPLVEDIRGTTDWSSLQDLQQGQRSQDMSGRGGKGWAGPDDEDRSAIKDTRSWEDLDRLQAEQRGEAPPGY
jgi:hypothetical protein